MVVFLFNSLDHIKLHNIYIYTHRERDRERETETDRDRKTRLSVGPRHRTVQEGLSMVSCRESITKSKHVLYWTLFTPNLRPSWGFFKACPVGLTDSYLVVSNIKHAWTLLYFLYMTPYSVLPAQCGAQESQRTLFVCFSLSLSLSLLSLIHI